MERYVAVLLERAKKTVTVLILLGARQNLQEDQCIFIRGFRVTRTFKLLPKHLKAAAEPSSDSDKDNSGPELELTSMPAIPKVSSVWPLLAFT
jgi:hypothetical protein